LAGSLVFVVLYCKHQLQCMVTTKKSFDFLCVLENVGTYGPSQNQQFETFQVDHGIQKRNRYR
jgi:hypothetical protein